MFRSLYISLIYALFVFSGLVAPFAFGLGYVWVDAFTPQNIAYSIMNEFPVSQVMAAGAVGLYLLLDRKRPPGMNVVTVLLIAMMGWVTFTTFNDPVAPEAAWGKWNWAIKTVVFSAFMPAMFRSRVQIESFLQVYVFSLAGQILPFAGKTILTGGKYGTSFGLVAGNSGLAEGAHLATVCLLLIPIILHLRGHSIILPRWRSVNLMYAGLVVACLAACVGTFERTAIVGAVVLAAGLWLRSRRKVMFGAIFAAGMVAAGSFVATSDSDWAARMRTIDTYSQDTSAYGRIMVWRWTLDFVKDHPFGGGFNAYLVDKLVLPGTPEHPEPIIDRGRAFHSAYFEMLGEHGWIGLGLFLGLCAATLLTLQSAAVRARRLAGMAWCNDLARALQISLLVPMVCGNFIGIAFQAEFYYLFALSVMLRHQVRSAEKLAAAPRQDTLYAGMAWMGAAAV